MTNDRVEELLEDAIAATNRTTRAVRGIAIFILIEVTSALIGAALIAFGVAIIEPSLIIVGCLVLLIGLIWAATSLKSELDDSAIPSVPKAPVQPPVSASDKAGSASEDMNGYERLVYSSLSEKEKQAWRKKGMPSLRGWDGRKSFEKWLNETPS